jgi:hypothetical protein
MLSEEFWKMVFLACGLAETVRVGMRQCGTETLDVQQEVFQYLCSPCEFIDVDDDCFQALELVSGPRKD